MKKKKVYRMIAAMCAMSVLVTGCGGKKEEMPSTQTQENNGVEVEAEESGGSKSFTDESVAESAESYLDGGMFNDFAYDTESVITDCYDYGYDYYWYEYNGEEYDKNTENGFSITSVSPLSTFSASVDTASYANVRRMIEDGYSIDYIPADAVRAEEFINYFSYDLKKPKAGEKFGVTVEVSQCPWNEKHELMFVGMATEEIDMSEAPDSNLVFLLDVSGSMSDSDKLPLLQESFKELVDDLSEKDKVSIVTYANGVETVLQGVSGDNKKEICEAIDSLYASGGTYGEGGIQQAYQLAEKYFIEGGNNRVLLATDGDLNIGISDADELADLISKKKDSGVYLSVLGFGTGNIKDNKMAALADNGNGNYSYIDSRLEAKKVLVEELGATLVTVADDVKLQVEFNPANVSSYRLIGYENKMLAATDFNDDTKDAGEIGAGHQVVALYEIIRTGSSDDITLKYQDNDRTEKVSESGAFSDEYATVSVRYKEPGNDKSKLTSYVVSTENFSRKPSEDFVFASLVAEFAMILSDSDNKGDSSLEYIMDTYKELDTDDEYKDEFYYLVRQMAKH